MALRWNRAWRCACLILCVSLGGCATAVFEEARSQYYAGDPVGGVALLDQAKLEDQIPGRDTLLFHLERGLMLHRAGLYAESAKAFVQASILIKDDERISLSEQATSLLSNDWSKRYFGEYSERLWAHTYAMMSFVMADEAESAAVEARQALQVLESYPEALESATFSRAMIALSFELAGQYNDAYVAYRRLHQQFPDAPVLAMATYRSAVQVASEETSNWRSKVKDDVWAGYASEGPEAVLLITSGRGPRKVSASLYHFNERLSFPAYVQAPQPHTALSVRDDAGKVLATEQVSTDTFSVAQTALSERGKLVLAKAALRGKVKHELVKGLRDNDQAAAEVLSLVFFLLEEADTRSWQSLPARLTLLRVPLAEGQENLTVSYGSRDVTLRLNPQQKKRPQVFSLHF